MSFGIGMMIGSFGGLPAPPLLLSSFSFPCEEKEEEEEARDGDEGVGGGGAGGALDEKCRRRGRRRGEGDAVDLQQ